MRHGAKCFNSVQCEVKEAMILSVKNVASWIIERRYLNRRPAFTLFEEAEDGFADNVGRREITFILNKGVQCAFRMLFLLLLLLLL